MIALQLSRESYAGLPSCTTMDAMFEQSAKGDHPIEITLLGIETDD